MRRDAWKFVLPLGAILVAGGCASDPRQGYSFSPTTDPSVHTVSVPVFENVTFATGIEVQLTEAIIKEIQRSTRWTVVSSDRADVTLSGQVVRSEYRRLSGDPVTGLDQEMGQDLRIDFDLKDNRTGKVLASRRGFGAMDTFVATRNNNERPEVGRFNTVQLLARDVVSELRSTW